jgi:hypothetical protein
MLSDRAIGIPFDDPKSEKYKNIPLCLENPKIGGVDDAEVVGDRIAEDGPVFRYLLTQEIQDGSAEIVVGRVLSTKTWPQGIHRVWMPPPMRRWSAVRQSRAQRNGVAQRGRGPICRRTRPNHAHNVTDPRREGEEHRLQRRTRRAR